VQNVEVAEPNISWAR